jgi:hypothetical protein
MIPRFKSPALLALCAFVALGVASGAQATPTATFTLNQTEVSQFPSGGVGTITLVQDGTNSVDVLVDLNPSGAGASFGFINTGGQHTPFVFNLANMAGLSIAFSQPTGGNFVNAGSFAFSLNTSGGGATPYGDFTGAIDIIPVQNGSSHAYFGDLAFTLTRVGGLTTDDFIANTDSTHAFFAADITDQSGHTGTVASTTRSFAAVPEPASLAILSVGMFGMGAVLRRRQVTTAPADAC